MVELFSRGRLAEFLAARVKSALSNLDRISEDEILARSTEDFVAELSAIAQLEPLEIGEDPVDGDVVNGVVQVRDHFDRSGSRTVKQSVFHIHAVYEFSGTPELPYFQPNQSLAYTTITADVADGTLTVRAVVAAGQRSEPDVRRAINDEIGKIRTNSGFSKNDVMQYNARLSDRFRPEVERRKKLAQDRRDLAGALGFPLRRRADAPAPVPVRRKTIGTSRGVSARSNREPYRDEPALTEAQYEDAIQVVISTLLAMERTPSVASGKEEEELRDQILVQLNGTFEGAATGETFIQKGKTDLLIRVEDRHVFVGECKWWSGEKACGEAIDQLLGYLPWRDEKAALILFIDRKDASAVIEKADSAIRSHAAFKRVGRTTGDKNKRRDYVLGHPDDPEREIKLAALFAVLPKATAGAAPTMTS